jgi:hypothetical protein
MAGGIDSLLALPLVWGTRRIGGPGGHMEGDGPVEGTCAGEGLPLAAQLESQPRPEPAAT